MGQQVDVRAPHGRSTQQLADHRLLPELALPPPHVLALFGGLSHPAQVCWFAPQVPLADEPGLHLAKGLSQQGFSPARVGPVRILAMPGPR